MLPKYFYLLVFMILPAESEVGLVLHHLDLSCYSNHSLVKRLKCQTIEKSYGHFVINFEGMVDENIGKDTDLHIKLYGKPLEAKKIVQIFDFKIDVCQVLQQGFVNSALNVFLNEIRRTSNIPFKCPIKGNFLYKVENFIISNSTLTKLLPSYTPALKATVLLAMYDKNQYMGELEAHATLLSGKN